MGERGEKAHAASKATACTKSEVGVRINEDRKLTAEVLKAMTERKSSEVLILLKGSDELLNPEKSEKPLPFACVQKTITRKNTLREASESLIRPTSVVCCGARERGPEERHWLLRA